MLRVFCQHSVKYLLKEKSVGELPASFKSRLELRMHAVFVPKTVNKAQSFAEGPN